MLCGRGFAQAKNDFSLVVLPDTQYYSAYYPQIFTAQTQWIAAHVKDMNIQLVLGVGDIVDTSNSTQWQNADAAVKYLDGAVPYLLAIGNHDYDKGDKAPLKRLVSGFNQYFGPSRYAQYNYYRGSFPDGSNENFYGIVNMGGSGFVVLMLEFYPRAEALQWASQILQANSDKEAIVVTHSYGYSNGRMTTCDNTASEAYGLNNDNDGEELWSFLSKFPNVILVLSGHVTSFNGVGRRADLGANGNLINQVLSDYQGYINGGNGYLRIMTFQPRLNQIQVWTYSPYTGTYLTDAANQFTLAYHAVAKPGTSGTVTGKVSDLATCAGIAGATVSDGVKNVFTDQFGNYALSSLSPGQHTITVSKAGFADLSKTTVVVGGYTNTLKFALRIAPPQ
jgi:hypothetical protein